MKKDYLIKHPDGNLSKCEDVEVDIDFLAGQVNDGVEYLEIPDTIDKNDYDFLTINVDKVEVDLVKKSDKEAKKLAKSDAKTRLDNLDLTKKLSDVDQAVRDLIVELREKE